jgi:hypothetical protein
MGAGLQTAVFGAQGIGGGANEALTPASGDSATFFNVPQESRPYLAEVWAVNDASPMDLSIVASRFYDQQSGIVYKVLDGSTQAPPEQPILLSAPGIDQRIFPSDVLTVQVDGTAGDNVAVTLLLYYPNIPGINARLATYQSVMAAAGNLVGIRATVTAGASTFGATVALNASDNRLHANRDHAVLGFTSEAPLAALTLQGVDVGNLRVGGPVLADGGHDGSLFLDYARAYNAPLVPIINSNNAGNILLSAAHTSADTVPVTVILAELDSSVGV